MTTLAVLIAAAGFVTWLFAGNFKISEFGKLVFFAGLFAFLRLDET